MAKANYWKAESVYMLNRFEEALASYTDFKRNSSARLTEEYNNVDYNLAYTHFKLRDYGNAITFFNSFSKSGTTEQEKLNDSYLRLGDSYFVTSKYWPAIETYNKALALSGPERTMRHFKKL